MLRLASLAIILGFQLVAVPAAAQQSLGAVLDAGGKRMSTREFETEIVQRMLVGPAPTGGELEMMYASNGSIAGTGTHPSFTISRVVVIGGEWKRDDVGRVCSSMRIADIQSQGLLDRSSMRSVDIQLPYRCQHWFKLADKYYVSDSDLDRSAKVLSRTIKQ